MTGRSTGRSSVVRRSSHVNEGGNRVGMRAGLGAALKIEAIGDQGKGEGEASRLACQACVIAFCSSCNSLLHACRPWVLPA